MKSSILFILSERKIHRLQQEFCTFKKMNRKKSYEKHTHKRVNKLNLCNLIFTFCVLFLHPKSLFYYIFKHRDVFGTEKDSSGSKQNNIMIILNLTHCILNGALKL